MVKDRLHGAMARRQIALGSGEEGQTFLDLCGNLPAGEHLHS